MIDYTINPIDWYSERKLSNTPIHFTIVATPITTESELWIRSVLVGRYSLTSSTSTDNDDLQFLFNFDEFPAFEDPKEALIYELKWS